jgi:phospholipase C
MENSEPTPGFDWVTMGELLEEAGISWRNYQETDNFDDNGFAWFDNYMTAKEGDPLWDKGMKRELDAIKAFENDVKADTLPQVSWIIAPANKSEHATYHPSAGEDWTARVLKALQTNPDVYAKSVFILNYDEGGQFYDHAWTPTPPMSDEEGISTVTTDGELNSDPNNLYSFDSTPQPIGMGFRVPLLVISPWSRGNIVVSEVMDHISTIKFIEERFNVSNPNISPWRRAMAGNMMSVFDFEGKPDYSWPNLPDTSNYVREGDKDCLKGDIVVPTEQSMPTQEAGVKVSRALPYEFIVSDSGADFSAGLFKFTVENKGSAGAPFVTFNTLDIKGTAPRPHAIEAGKSMEDVGKVSESGKYDFYFSGPNGFTRLFGGDKTDLPIATSMTYDKDNSNVVVNVDLSAVKQDVSFTLEDLGEYGVLDGKTTFTVKGGEKGSQNVFVGDDAVGNWYDLKLSIADSAYYRRFLGRMETGKDTISDPAMAKGVKGLWNKAEEGSHPPVPERMRSVPRPNGEEYVGLYVGAKAPIDKDGRYEF